MNQQHVASKKAKIINILFILGAAFIMFVHAAFTRKRKEDGRATKKAAMPSSANVVLWMPCLYAVPSTCLYVCEEEDDDDIA